MDAQSRVVVPPHFEVYIEEEMGVTGPSEEGWDGVQFSPCYSATARRSFPPGQGASAES